jgi:hypothetical protein
MGPGRMDQTKRISRRRRAVACGLCASGLLLAAGVIARADVFHLQNGGTVEGQLLSSADGNYEIRTTVGVVTISADSVAEVETKSTPFEEYERRRSEAPATAAAQTELAAWCEEQGLTAERLRHLRSALQIDPDYAPARRALGYVRVGDWWIDGRRTTGRTEPARASEQSEGERLARAIQVQWRLRIRAICDSQLTSPQPDVVQRGRARILAIKDPLAILPLTAELSSRDLPFRQLLITMLASFSQDEATLNLAVAGLTDPDGDLRAAAVAELARRNDPRVAAQYLDALRNGNDWVIARAATGLAALRVRTAIPDLIRRLTAVRDRWVEFPIDRYFGGWPVIFHDRTLVTISAGVQADHAPEIGVLHGAPYYGDEPRSEWQFRPATVYRTEVLEALKSLTGENFGFERAEWEQWYRTHATADAATTAPASP